jgi:hypothetical protein
MNPFVSHLFCFFILWQLLLFALPEEFDKIRDNFEEAAKFFKRKVWKC